MSVAWLFLFSLVTPKFDSYEIRKEASDNNSLRTRAIQNRLVKRLSKMGINKEIDSSSFEDRVRHCIPPGWNDIQVTQKLGKLV